LGALDEDPVGLEKFVVSRILKFWAKRYAAIAEFGQQVTQLGQTRSMGV
jgi:hypothetical protein